MMLFGFGRVPGCLGLGALFLWDEWRDERTDSRPAGSLSVLFFGGVRCGGLFEGCLGFGFGGEWSVCVIMWFCRF